VSADLSFALIRLDQIEERIRSKHPRAAQDSHLAALLNSLRDDLADQKIIITESRD